MLPDPKTIRYIQPREVADTTAPIVDTRSPEAYAQSHLESARNICVYETAFVDEIPKAFPDSTTALLVYGQNETYKAAEAAIAKLQSIGYQNARVIQGGLEACQLAGLPIEKTNPSQEQTSQTGTYKLDTDKTKVRWYGRNLSNQHAGEIAAQSGSLSLDASGLPSSGEVTLDMNAITCSDILDTKMNRMLIAHLSNADFFQTDKYPTASFRLESATPIPDAAAGSPNLDVQGSIAIRGVTQPIAIQATLAPTGDALAFQTQFELDRTQFGAIYGSGRFFESLGMHLVNDHVSLQIIAIFQPATSIPADA